VDIVFGEMHCPEMETPYFFGKRIVPKWKCLIFSGNALSRNGNALFFQETHCPETEMPYFSGKRIVPKRKCLIFSGNALSRNGNALFFQETHYPETETHYLLSGFRSHGPSSRSTALFSIIQRSDSLHL
jgi:hypothetical protein